MLLIPSLGNMAAGTLHIVGLVPDHSNKVSITIERVVIFFDGGPCLQFLRHATSAKQNKVKYVVLVLTQQYKGRTHLAQRDKTMLQNNSRAWDRAEEVS